MRGAGKSKKMFLDIVSVEGKYVFTGNYLPKQPSMNHIIRMESFKVIKRCAHQLNCNTLQYQLQARVQRCRLPCSTQTDDQPALIQTQPRAGGHGGYNASLAKCIFVTDTVCVKPGHGEREDSEVMTRGKRRNTR